MILPVEPQLLVDNNSNGPTQLITNTDCDVESLFQYLCINKNLKEVTVGQCVGDRRIPTTFEVAQPSPSSSASREQHDNDVLLPDEQRGLYSQFTGIITRSKSQKIRQQSLSTHSNSSQSNHHHHDGPESQETYDFELDLMSTKNLSLIRKDSVGSKSQ